MALEAILNPEIANEMLDVLGDACNSGNMKFSSAAVPANLDVAESGILATLTFAAEAFQPATDADPSVLAALEAEITPEAGEATGEALWFRIGVVTTPKHFQGQAGVGASFDMDMNVQEITSGAQVSVETLDITLPLGT